jgi:hypothetical protein
VTCTGAGDGLDRGDALLGEGGGVGAQDELARLAGEGGEAGDGEVFVVEVGVVTDDLVGLE